MSIVLLLVLSSVVAASAFLIAFLWATASGQYDDIHTPAIRILFEDQPLSPTRAPIRKREGVEGKELFKP